MKLAKTELDSELYLCLTIKKMNQKVEFSSCAEAVNIFTEKYSVNPLPPHTHTLGWLGNATEIAHTCKPLGDEECCKGIYFKH